MTTLEEIDKLIELCKAWDNAESNHIRENPNYNYAEDKKAIKIFEKLATSTADIALRLDVDANELADKIVNSTPSWSIEDTLNYLKSRIN